MGIFEQKTEEMDQKLAAFRGALKVWFTERRSAKEFSIHRTQLDAIEAILNGVSVGLTEEVASARQDGSILERGAVIEATILAGYQVWEFYRQKFAQRLEAQFRSHLRVADEFAWACYRPLREATFGAQPRGKEPPLVYLNSNWSPFLKQRDQAYQVEAVPRALLARQSNFQKALAQLPFPLIGVPWYQAGFLPWSLTIAHEVGHAVEADCQLTEPILEAVEHAVEDAQRRAKWQAWSSEMFADAYGCLCVGPVFARSLADTLSADRATVDADIDLAYPPVSLRIQLNCVILTKQRHSAAATELWGRWKEQYPPPFPWSAYAADIEPVAEALLNLPVNRMKGKQVPLTKLIEFPPGWDTAAKDYAKKTCEGITAGQNDMRISFAAARHAFEFDPSAFTRVEKTEKGEQRSVAERFLMQIRAACPDDIRHGEKPPPKGRTQLLHELGERLLRTEDK